MMNIYDDIVARILKECPEFEETWVKHVNWMKSIGKSHTIGVSITVALFLDQSYISRQTHFFPRFFAVFERLLTEDEDAGTAVVEIFESIWRCRVTRANGPELYATWMGPETKRHWEQVGKNVIAKTPKLAQKRPRKQPGSLPEYQVTLRKCEPGETAVPPDYYKTTGPGTATKFGGDPNWIHPDERVVCPCCNQDMTFIAQIDSIENTPLDPGVRREMRKDPERLAAHKRDHQWVFADVGMIYVFFCFDCLQTNAVFQCY